MSEIVQQPLFCKPNREIERSCRSSFQQQCMFIGIRRILGGQRSGHGYVIDQRFQLEQGGNFRCCPFQTGAHFLPRQNLSVRTVDPLGGVLYSVARKFPSRPVGDRS